MLSKFSLPLRVKWNWKTFISIAFQRICEIQGLKFYTDSILNLSFISLIKWMIHHQCQEIFCQKQTVKDSVAIHYIAINNDAKINWVLSVWQIISRDG